MKTMKKILMIAVTMFVSVACLNPDGYDNSYTSEFVGMMTTVNTSTQSAYEDPTTVRIIQEKLTIPEVDIEINDVKFVPMMPDVNFTIEDLAFSVYTSDDVNDPLLGFYKINYMSVVPKVGGVAREDYTMHNFIAYIGDQTINIDFDVNFGGAVYHAAFRLADNADEAEWESSYEVVASTVGAGATFTDDATVTAVQESKLELLTITLNNIRFNQMMPEVNFTLLNIPFDMVGDSKTRNVEVETVIPIVGSNPMPTYAMDNLRGTFDENGGCSLSFEITLGGATYNVTLLKANKQ